jgi:endonuclease I
MLTVWPARLGLEEWVGTHRLKRRADVYRFAWLGLSVTTLAACGQSIGAVRVGEPLAAVSAGGAITSHYRAVKQQTGAALLAVLHPLSAKGQRVLTYDRARDLLFGTIDDPANQNRVKDVYLGRTGEGITNSRDAFHRSLNAEHTWPQSLGAENEPVRSDLHHIFPVDAGANTQRNRHPLGIPERSIEVLPDFDKSGLRSRIGLQGASQVVFEPRADHRGDAARAMFYVFTRYALDRKLGQKISLKNFKDEQAILLRWHAEDPVSDSERARHERIVKKQGNRNPFIDYPEYVTRIGDFLGKRN